MTDLDRAVALCAIVTAVTRGAYDVAPMFLFVAPAAGTGKSHLVDLVSLIARGRPCPVITAAKSDEEMEKRLGALLLEGAAIVSLDNCTHELEGDMLCQLTERPLVKARILGKSEVPECQWRGTLLGTGNNVGFAGDMVRRGLTSYLDAGLEIPEGRSFGFDPHEAVKADRGKYIAAALTIARAYIVGQHKTDCRPIGSYGAWSRFAREPLMWLGIPDPVRSMDRAREEDPRRRAARELIEHLKKNFDGREFSVKQIIDKADEWLEDPGSMPGERKWPEFHELLIEQCSSSARGQVDRTRLGLWLKRLKGQVYTDREGAQHKLVVTENTTRANSFCLVRMDEPIPLIPFDTLF